MSRPRLSIAVLSWNSKEITRDCLSSLLQHVRGVDYELIVIENASHDGSAEMIRSEFNAQTYPRIRAFFNDKNLGFAGGNNQAYRQARGEYFLLLNSDTIVQDDSIEQMVRFLDKRPDYAAATTTLLNRDGSIQYYMHRRFPAAGTLLLALIHKRWPRFRPRNVRRYLYLDNNFLVDFDIEQAAGACLMIKRSCVNDIGGLFDEKHFPLYYNDVDLCYRVCTHGGRIRCLANSPITHLKGTSVRKLDFFGNGKEYVYSSLWFFKKTHQFASYWLLKILYFLLFAGINATTPIWFAIGRISSDQVHYRWSILKTIITLRR